VLVETNYVDSPAAKLKFEYKIFEAKSGTVVAKGSSVQVFVDVHNFELQLTLPPFFEAWKRKNNLI
jgi:acyl-CoA thioester hydrolase